MVKRYAVSESVAWVEALDGGRQDRTVWMADLRTGDYFTLEGTGWLIWILLDEGAATAGELVMAATDSGTEAAFADFDLPAFLNMLVAKGLLTSDEGV